MKEKKILTAFCAAFVALTASSGVLMGTSVGFIPTFAAYGDQTYGDESYHGGNQSYTDGNQSYTDSNQSYNDNQSYIDPPHYSSTGAHQTPVTSSIVTTAPITTAPTTTTTVKTTELPEENGKTEVKVKVDDLNAAKKVPAKNKVKNIAVVSPEDLKDKNGKSIDISKVKFGAKEIFDTKTVKSAKKAVTKVLKTPAANLNVVDLSMKIGKTNLSKSFDGKISVTIEAPRGYKGKKLRLYRIVEKKGKMTAKLISGTLTKDGYEVELEEFGMFVLVAEDKAE